MNQPILAIDPGTRESAWILWNGAHPVDFGIVPNDQIFPVLKTLAVSTTPLVIEKVESYGMAVGVETFDTVHWAGRFHEHWRLNGGGGVEMLGRKAIKMHLCQSMKAKDANIRQALIDRFGEVGTKKQPGVLYGISKHLWAALAVAVTAYDQSQAAQS